MQSLLTSITSGLITTLIITALSIIVGPYVTRSKGPLTKFYRRAALLPLVALSFIFSLSLIALFGRNGIVNNFLSGWFDIEFSIYGYWGVVIAQVLAYFPVGYMMVESTLRNMSPSIEHA